MALMTMAARNSHKRERGKTIIKPSFLFKNALGRACPIKGRRQYSTKRRFLQEFALFFARTA
jgi:hypothetical protein